MSSKYAIGAHKGEGSRPTKRRRVEMPTPDGFISSTSTKPIHKPPAPRFYSTFDDDKDRAFDKKEIDAQKAQAKPATVSKLPVIGFGQPDNPFNGNAVNQRTERPKEKKKLDSVMDIKVSLNPTTKPRSTANLRPAPPPPTVSTSSFIANAGFKQIVPPAFPVLKSSSKPLPVLQRPVIPVPRPIVSTKKELRTLSTTGLGILNDLSSDNVAEGLAPILLRDQHPELSVNHPDGDSIANRGLEMSPEKKSKNKNTKFVRGGLAARASSYFDRSSTAHILWKKELEHTPNKLLSSEFCASVIKILHKPIHTLRPPTYSPGIALCRIRQQSGIQHPLYKPDHLYRVVFATLNASSTNFPTRFAEGQTVLVFKPWQELSTHPSGQVLENLDLPRPPLRLPLPVSTPDLTPDPLNTPVHDIALVCTRFHIQQ